MSLNIHTDISLKNFTTMRVGGAARFMVDVHSPAEVREIIVRAKEQQLPFFVLGGGSNTLVHDDGYRGIVIHNRISGFEVAEENAGDTTIRIGAGESWDDVVKRTVDMHLSGIECLSAIPGTAGAAPVQNIGAYGQEVSEVIVSVDVYDTTTDQFVTLTNDDCQFGYRNSIFRSSAMGRYVILSLTLRLRRAMPAPPFYAALQDYLDQHSISVYTHQAVRDAIIAIRADKLPDPSKRPNSGSFFKNAIIEDWQLADLKENYPEIPTYDMPEGRFKIPTGWLIEQAGYKGKLLHGIRVHDKNALVLINESATSYQDVALARDEIIGAVRDTFRIQIEQEPLEMQ